MRSPFLSCVVAACLVLGCATTTGKLKRAWRKPGEHFVSFPEKVWEDYGCGERELPYFQIEKVELNPKRLRPGEQFNHRLVYALCPTEPTAVVSGTLETRIVFRGASIVRQRDTDYELKPGRWIVDSFVTVPPEATTGIYSIRLVFKGPAVRFEEDLVFAVEVEDPDQG